MAEGVQDSTKVPAVLQGDKQFAEPASPPPAARVGVGLIAIALILPLLGGYLLLWVTSVGSVIAIIASTILLTSLLLAIDAHRLGNVDPTGRRWPSAWVLFLALCAVWVLFYPDAFFRRRHFIRPNLGLSAILVVMFFVGGPLVRYFSLPVELPECDSREVIYLVEQGLDKLAISNRIQSIDGHHEIGFEFEPERRLGQCVAHTADGDIPINYYVKWRDTGHAGIEIGIMDFPATPAKQ
ncbi:MAG TPA: hypothetical protein VGP68_17645 [Gemmataceae bacterium]|jgi:hypothetical protein|nr:hypothetical protein [Gemmataceae bacterium]